MVAESQTGLDEKKAHKIFHQLIDSVEHLHDSDVVHRDIKLNNMFVKDKGNEDILLSDFGASEIFAGKGRKRLDLKVGTLGYMAPEMFKRKTMYYEGPPTDIFSCGQVLYLLLNAKPMFFQDNHMISPEENVHYKSFMVNPGRVKTERKLSANAAALDLI